MNIFRAFLYPFQSPPHRSNFARLLVSLIIPGLNIVITLNALLLTIRHRLCEDDTQPPLRLKLIEAFDVVGGWSLAFLAPAAGLEKLLISYHRTHDTSLFFLCLVVLGAAFCVGLLRYATTGDATTLIQIPSNLAHMWQHKITALRFALNTILYSILLYFLDGFLMHVILNMFSLNIEVSYRFVAPVMGIISIGFLISGIGYFLGQWAQALTLEDGSGEDKAKRKNDALYGQEKSG